MYLRFLMVLITLLLLIACESGQQQGQKADGNPAFHTTAPSLLYFKNMRSSYYQMEEQPGSRIELYRLNRFDDTQSRPILYPIIANNWLQDEAYLFLEKNDYEKGFAEPLKVKVINSEGGSGKAESGSGNSPRRASATLREGENGENSKVILELSPVSVLKQYELAMKIYEALRAQKAIQVQDAEGNWQPIFEDKQDRQHFMSSVRDYLRLTEAE